MSDDYKEVDHKSLVEYIMKNNVITPCTIMNVMPPGVEEFDLFEFFLNVFMEFISYSTQDFKHITANDINAENLQKYAPYMNTICVITDIKEYSRTEDVEYINKYFCRIALRLTEETFFIAKSLSTNFHFLLHQMYVGDKSKLKLKDLYAVFHAKNNKVIKISFSICNHSSHQKQVQKASKDVGYSELF